MPETVRAAALDPVDCRPTRRTRRGALAVKRALDVVGATIGLLLSIPIVGLAMVAIDAMRAAALARAPALVWERSARRLVAAYEWLLDHGPAVAGEQHIDVAEVGAAA